MKTRKNIVSRDTTEDIWQVHTLGLNKGKAAGDRRAIVNLICKFDKDLTINPDLLVREDMEYLIKMLDWIVENLYIQTKTRAERLMEMSSICARDIE